MIFGNPQEFALYVDIVDEWSKLHNNLEGLSGIWLKDQLLITNTGLISLKNDFENIIEQAPKLVECSKLYELEKLDLLKELLSLRFPNWCAASSSEWDENIDEWHDIKEVYSCDLSFESFHSGHEINQYLLGVRHNSMMKLLLYRKNKEEDFFNFEKIIENDVVCLKLSYEKFQWTVTQLDNYVSKAFRKLHDQLIRHQND